MFMDFSNFYDQYHHRVVGYLLSKVDNAQDAEDLASQVFIYCYENWDNYDPGKASLQSWLYLIVRSRWKNYCRDKRIMERLEDFQELLRDQCDFTDEAARLDLLRQQLAEALERLSEQQRKVVILRYYLDMPDKEIAARLSLSSVHVRVISHRALRKLESILRGKLE